VVDIYICLFIENVVVNKGGYGKRREGVQKRQVQVVVNDDDDDDDDMIVNEIMRTEERRIFVVRIIRRLRTELS